MKRALAELRVGLYARVSTSEQDVAAPADRLRREEARILAGLPRSVDEFVDDATSCRLVSRPQLDRLRAAVVARGLDVVVAAKLDRLGRSARAVLEFCEANRVRVVMVDQSIDTSTPAGKFLRTALAAAAELESDLNTERTRDRVRGIQDHYRQTGEWDTRSGRAIGRPRRVTPELLDRIRELRLAMEGGLPPGPPAGGTVRNALRDARRRRKPRAENPPGAFASQSGESQRAR